MCVHLRFVFIDHQSEPLADASMFEIPNRGVVVGSGSADSGANFHQNTSPKTPRPEPNHQEHQQRYNRKGIRGKIQAKHKQEKQPTKYRTILLCFFVHALSPWCLLFRFIFSHNITATFLVFESRCARQARRGSRATAWHHLEIFHYIRCFSWRLRRRISLVSLQRTERNTIQCWRHRIGRTLSGSKVTGRSNCKVAISVFESYSSWNLFWRVGCTKRISLLFVQKPFASLRWRHDLMASTFTNYNTFQS